jgi:hypothetical protein
MNNSGQVVGETMNAAGAVVPILWEKGTMTALADLIPADSGWELISAYRIGDGGHIFGYGTFQGQGTWYLLSLNRNQNQPPVAVAGASQVLECTGTETIVTLNASGSTDPEGDPLRYEWYYQNGLLSTNAVVSLGFALGTYQIQLRVTDPGNASAQDSTSVTVVDTTAPTLVCPAPLSLAANAQSQAVVPDLSASLAASDNCTPANKLTKSQTPPAGTVVGLGPTQVRISVTDGAGNVSSCNTTLTVVDATPPAILSPASVTLAANDKCQAVVPDFLAGLVASDNCTPANLLVKSQTPAAGTLVELGSTVVQITVADASGNVGACATTVTVEDRTAPVIQSVTANPPSLSPPNKAMVPVTITVGAIDNCGPAPVSRIISVTSNEPVTGKGDNTSPDWQITGALTVNLRAEGQNARVYTVTIQCTDAAGNQTTATLPISVEKSKPKK